MTAEFVGSRQGGSVRKSRARLLATAKQNKTSTKQRRQETRPSLCLFFSLFFLSFSFLYGTKASTKPRILSNYPTIAGIYLPLCRFALLHEALMTFV